MFVDDFVWIEIICLFIEDENSTFKEERKHITEQFVRL